MVLLKKEKKFVMLRSLGKGSFGKVKEALHIASNMTIAIKILEKDKIAQMQDDKRVKREIAILKQLIHPNVITLYEVCEW